jgi:hypothetical protein
MRSKYVQIRFAVASVLLAGCFHYEPSATPVPAGREVRLDLTDAGRVAVAPLAGEGVDRIEGVVDSFAPDTIEVRVTSMRRRDVSEMWTREQFKIAARDVSAVSVRRFSPSRTALLTGAVALVAASVRLGTSENFLGGKKSGGGSSGGSR